MLSHRFVLAGLVAAFFATGAHAATVGFQLTVATTASSGDRPQFTLMNISDVETITAFTFAINAPGYWFDYIYNETVVSGSLTRSRTVGQSVANETSGTTSLAYTTTGFGPTEAFRFRADLDAVNTADSTTNFRSVFFNNGGAAVPNATVSVSFSDGRNLSLTLSGSAGQSSYIYSAAIDDTAEVPLPATLPLALAGCVGLGLLARRRKS
ncbi:VPLPA-CTERM sorting domain-containing protein [Citreicella sp. C3M06]|uniref:VPLPA-CTERM sorting domain-containing protein n=1 Tax=Citreicella sp. C3M06 TaxID=2841564 RepID=UPI001C091104|nr:VPLPA-CTERM sorting domain-containing protein [Citreicella sp. C3M06]MBU2960428.1 VPLPA-CTERM sorting domain-containing protein [Citreicella sp. C3M06]